jgi:hypothetical protein
MSNLSKEQYLTSLFFILLAVITDGLPILERISKIDLHRLPTEYPKMREMSAWVAAETVS